MWGFLLRFLSGRMLAGLAAVSLVGLLASGFLWLRSVERKAATQEVLVQTLRAELENTRKALREEQRRRQQTVQLLASMNERLRDIQKRYRARVDTLRGIPDEGCLDRPIPAAVDGLLRD